MKWNKKKVILELKRYNKILEHSPSKREVPSKLESSARYYFGSWNKAKLKANLKICKLKICPKYKLAKSSYRPSKELAYVVGVILGDGCLTGGGNVKLKTIDREFVNFWATQFKKWSGVKLHIRKFKSDGKQIIAYIYFSEAFTFLKKFKNNSLYCLEFFPKKYWKWVLKGLWDSEGSITLRTTNTFHIRFRNTDFEILELYHKILLSLGFNTNADSYKKHLEIKITNIPDCLRFIKEIGVTIERKLKKEKIEKIIKRAEESYKKFGSNSPFFNRRMRWRGRNFLSCSDTTNDVLNGAGGRDSFSISSKSNYEEGKYE